MFIFQTHITFWGAVLSQIIGIPLMLFFKRYQTYEQSDEPPETREEMQARIDRNLTDNPFSFKWQSPIRFE